MIEPFRDIFDCLKSHWQAVLGQSVAVEIAFADERVRTQIEQVYPVALLSNIAIAIDPSRQHAVPDGVVSTDLEAGMVKIQKAPVPVSLDFQLDLHCQKRDDHWHYSGILLAALGSRMTTQLITKSNRKFFITGPIESIELPEPDSIWRTAFRFRIDTWLTDEELLEVGIIEQRVFEINDVPIEFAEEI